MKAIRWRGALVALCAATLALGSAPGCSDDGDPPTDAATGDGDAAVTDGPVADGLPPKTDASDQDPTADDQSVTLVVDAQLAITLTGSDPQGDRLSFHVDAAPSHGVVSGSGPTLLYIPDPGYVGADQLTFFASDGVHRSFSATVSIAITDRQRRYVAAGGSCSDDGPGSEATPWCTLDHASAEAVAGDLVLIAPGDYGDDLLAPVSSGEVGRPITFRRHGTGEVLIGGQGNTGPIANIDLRDVDHVELDGLTVKQVRGWLFARNTSFITVRNCRFVDGLNDGKGAVKFFESDNVRFVDNELENGYDNLVLIKSERVLVARNVFRVGRHALLAVRCSSSCVFRANHLTNTYLDNPEKLVEVYDCKGGGSPPGDIGVFLDDTRHNLFERNYLGYTPPITDRNARTSAMQYSGQQSIIRHNLFSHGNPPIAVPAPGGVGLNLRLGGSVSEGPEAQYVHGNRIYHNTFYAYDAAAITVPPWDDKFPAAIFADNRFVNNTLSHGLYDNTSNSSQPTKVFWDGKPVQLAISTLHGVRFRANNFYAPVGDQVIADAQNAEPVAWWQTHHAAEFVGNLQHDPQLTAAAEDDVTLAAGSALRDAGEPLTTTVGAGAESAVMVVDDALFLFAGHGIAGERGDEIQLASGGRALVVDVDYDSNELLLDRALSWGAGEGVSLSFEGTAPDIGACESGRSCSFPGD